MAQAKTKKKLSGGGWFGKSLKEKAKEAKEKAHEANMAFESAKREAISAWGVSDFLDYPLVKDAKQKLDEANKNFEEAEAEARGITVEELRAQNEEMMLRAAAAMNTRMRPRRGRPEDEEKATAEAAGGGKSRKCKRRKVRQNPDGSFNQKDMEHNKKCEQQNMMVDNPWMKSVLNKKNPTGYNKYLKHLVIKRKATLKKNSKKSRKSKKSKKSRKSKKSKKSKKSRKSKK